MSEIDRLAPMYPASDLKPMIDVMRQNGLETEALFHAIRIFVVRMPLNLGGSPLGAYWTRKFAENLIESLKNDSFWQHEIDFRKELHMEPVGEFVIEEIPLAALGLIGG